MIKRNAEKELRYLAQQFKAVAVTGPRQAGKSTLVRHVFNDRPYVSLENPDNMDFAINDPRGFLNTYSDGAVFDEIQRTPQLFSYLQQVLDEEKKPGKYILTGSNNFLLQDKISQSLAGRIAYLVLLPFSLREMKGLQDGTPEKMIFQGCYPPVYDQKIDPLRWYINYVNTYIERDVRQTIKINNQPAFSRFIKLCAGRVGQLLNMNNLAVETGVDNKTIASWISMLENSFIAYRLNPYYKNFNKRVVKTPKLYFYDTGLASYLLGIKEVSQVKLHPLYGSLFENLVMSECIKTQKHFALPVALYFWRDNTGHETDLLIEGYNTVYPVEIKAGETINNDYLNNLLFFQKIAKTDHGALIYAGKQFQQRSNQIKIFPWLNIYDLFTQIKNS